MNSLLNPAGYVTRLAIRLEYILYLLGLDPTVAIEGFRPNRGNFKERDFFLQKCFDRHFIGSVQYGRACPSLNDALARNPYGWEAFPIRRFKIQSMGRAPRRERVSKT